MLRRLPVRTNSRGNAKLPSTNSLFRLADLLRRRILALLGISPREPQAGFLVFQHCARPVWLQPRLRRDHVSHPFGETASQARTPSPQQASRFLRWVAGLVLVPQIVDEDRKPH